MEHDFSWIYLLFFLMIPLARIIPRVLSKLRNKDNSFSQRPEFDEFEPNSEEFIEETEKLVQKPKQEFRKPSTKKMLVLGELNRGTKSFENVQKNTGLTNDELDKILEELENNGFIEVRQKQGMLGLKIELYPTEKGIKEYYS